jgi:hypothetical protein
MKLTKSIFLALLTVVVFSLSALAQEDVFKDPTVDYTFALPDATWKMTVRPSATNPNVEYVYRDRRDGHLSVRKLAVAKDAILTDVIQDEAQKVQIWPGFVAGREENFGGKLRGSVFNFEYVNAGKAMAGRYYFLRANETTVYLLRFAGPKDGLRVLRSQTDSIARTFNIKS